MNTDLNMALAIAKILEESLVRKMVLPFVMGAVDSRGAAVPLHRCAGPAIDCQIEATAFVAKFSKHVAAAPPCFIVITDANDAGVKIEVGPAHDTANPRGTAH